MCSSQPLRFLHQCRHGQQTERMRIAGPSLPQLLQHLEQQRLHRHGHRYRQYRISRLLTPRPRPLRAAGASQQAAEQREPRPLL